MSHALGQGHRVVGVSRSPEPSRPFLPRLWQEPKGLYSFHQLDLNRDPDALASLLHKERPAIVVNFAAQGMVAQSWDSPWDWFQTNTVGLSRFLEALSGKPWLQKYVHVTTPEVYGSTNGWVKESLDFRPSTPYATSRAAGDWHVLNLMRTKDLPAVLTRAANVYGPGQQLYRVIPRAFLSGFLKEEFPLDGSGLSTRSFIHIKDVVDATYRLATSNFSGETFHISTKRLVSIRDLTYMVNHSLGPSHNVEVKQMPERSGLDQTYQLDSTKLRETLGWSDTVALEDGLDEVKRWVHNNLDALRAATRQYIHQR